MLIKPCVHVVYVECTDRHRKKGLSTLASWVARVLPGCPADIVVVDNAEEGVVESSIDDNATLVSGDNSSREFSGMDVGVAWFVAKRALNDNDVFVLANDTFHRSYGTEYLDLFSPKKVRKSLARGRIVGWVDAYSFYPSVEFELFGLTLRSWVRTNLVVLPYSVLRMLQPLAIPFPDEQIFSSHYPPFFRDDAPLSANYRALIHEWVTGETLEGVPVKDAWRSHQRLTEENAALLRAKARAILCEHYLSARARDRGISLDSVRRDTRRYRVRTRRLVDGLRSGLRRTFS